MGLSPSLEGGPGCVDLRSLWSLLKSIPSRVGTGTVSHLRFGLTVLLSVTCFRFVVRSFLLAKTTLFFPFILPEPSLVAPFPGFQHTFFKHLLWDRSSTYTRSFPASQALCCVLTVQLRLSQFDLPGLPSRVTLLK